LCLPLLLLLQLLWGQHTLFPSFFWLLAAAGVCLSRYCCGDAAGVDLR
jgi:hypothetical protein